MESSTLSAVRDGSWPNLTALHRGVCASRRGPGRLLCQTDQAGRVPIVRGSVVVAPLALQAFSRWLPTRSLSLIVHCRPLGSRRPFLDLPHTWI